MKIVLRNSCTLHEAWTRLLNLWLARKSEWQLGRPSSWARRCFPDYDSVACLVSADFVSEWHQAEAAAQESAAVAARARIRLEAEFERVALDLGRKMRSKPLDFQI